MDADTASDLGYSVLKTTLSLPVKAIECGKGIMNRKLRKALREENYPLITYDLIQPIEHIIEKDTNYEFTSLGVVRVGGVEKEIEAKIKLTKQGESNLIFEGEIQLLMTDFMVNPPTAMFGALKTDNEITISFSIITDSWNAKS